jgi:hypothetical protein
VESDKSALVTLVGQLGLLNLERRPKSKHLGVPKKERERFLQGFPALTWKMNLPVFTKDTKEGQNTRQSIVAVPHLPLLSGFARSKSSSLWVFSSAASPSSLRPRARPSKNEIT